MDYAFEIYKLVSDIKSKNLTNFLSNNFKGLCVILKIIESSKGEIISEDIASKLSISNARVSTALNVLDEKGYIKRIKSEQDGRKSYIVITEQGRDFLKEREKEIIEKIGNLLSRLEEDEKLSLLTILKKILGE